MRITNEMIAVAYEIAKEFVSNKMSRTETADEIVRVNGMNRNSALDYVSNLKYMLEGRRYVRVMSAAAVKYYLEHIRMDYGEMYYQNARQAVELHIDYIEGLGYTRLHAIDRVLSELN